MFTDTITIPVRATMHRQPDGSFRMIDADYAITSTDTLARFLASILAPLAERSVKEGEST